MTCIGRFIRPKNDARIDQNSSPNNFRTAVLYEKEPKYASRAGDPHDIYKRRDV